jgi:hypothetical protein
MYANPQIGVNRALYISDEILDYISSQVPERSFRFLRTPGTVPENWETKKEYLTMTAFIEKQNRSKEFYLLGYNAVQSVESQNRFVFKHPIPGSLLFIVF